MQVVLISADADLYKLCRSILQECGNPDWSLSLATPENGQADADLYIWDDPAALRTRTAQPAQHFVLLPRSKVSAFRQTHSAAILLLKPVTRTCLSAFLTLAVAAWRERRSADPAEMLVQSNLRLQEYDQDRTHFLARTVHDFRAPLTATMGYCELLQDGAFGPLTSEQREVLRRMQHASKRLSRMATALFEWSLEHQGKRRPELRPGRIQDCVEQTLHEITPLAHSKNITLNADLAAPGGPLYFEPGQMEQVLLNLLDNACKFTPQNGWIEIRGYPYFWEGSSRPPSSSHGQQSPVAPNAYRVDICGSGPLIAREHLETIFEEYTSYGTATERSGGGLGLAICRMFLAAHEGHVWAENTSRGPCFSFVLPVGAEEAEIPASGRQPELIHSEI